MKSSAERKLLFALLLSSLVPVIALGITAAAVVHRMGRDLQRQADETQTTRVQATATLRCIEAAERLTTFFRRRQTELRALTLVERRSERYQAFRHTTLGPLQIDGPTGERSRIWIPLFLEIVFRDVAGLEDVAARDDELPPAAPGASIPEYFQRATNQRRGHVWIGAARLPPGALSGGRTDSLRLAMPVHDEHGNLEGVVSALLDPRHLELTTPPGASEALPFTVSRAAFYARTADGALFFPTLAAAFDPTVATAIRSHLPELLADLTRETPPSEPRTVLPGLCLANAPVALDAGPHQAPVPVGGVILAARFDTTGPARGADPALLRSTEVHLGFLTVSAVLGVALAALLVANRMARPWTRLREKAQSVSASQFAEPLPDDLAEITRSFDSLADQVASSAVRLRASEERMREFFEMSPDGIAVIGTSSGGSLLHFNRSLCQMLRRTPEQLGQLSPGGMCASPYDWYRLLETLRVRGRIRNYELELRRGDGSTFPALLSLRLTGAAQESVDLVVRDVSELKDSQRRDREKTEALFRVYGELSQAHQALRRAYTEVEDQVRQKTSELRTAYEALQTADRVKTEFLMKMSHELRTPLNCIIGYSEAMSEGIDGPVTPDQADSLERIASSGRRLLRMIEDLLDLSRLEAGAMTFACTELRAEEAVEEVLHQARNLVGERPIRLEVALEEPLPAVWADPDRVRQVLFNLVGNAIKFTQQGTVRIAARQLGPGFVEVAVADTGPGIPSDQLETIFQKFTQLSRPGSGGAGLGLPICREILEAMGGRIWADSQPGSGARFAFTLPTLGGRGQLPLPFPHQTPTLAAHEAGEPDG